MRIGQYQLRNRSDRSAYALALPQTFRDAVLSEMGSD